MSDEPCGSEQQDRCSHAAQHARQTNESTIDQQIEPRVQAVQSDLRQPRRSRFREGARQTVDLLNLRRAGCARLQMPLNLRALIRRQFTIAVRVKLTVQRALSHDILTACNVLSARDPFSLR